MNDCEKANLAIFCAALQGAISNPELFGAISVDHPWSTVEFARECVREAYMHNGNLLTHLDLTGSGGVRADVPAEDHIFWGNGHD